MRKSMNMHQSMTLILNSQEATYSEIVHESGGIF